MVERLKRLWYVWLALAVVCAVVLPRLIDAGAAGKPRAPEATPATPARFVVRDPEGAAIGWLNIRYPRAIRENEEGVIEAEYTTGKAKWNAVGVDGYGDVTPPSAMNLQFSGAGLTLTPDPRHVFDIQRIAATGVERVKWIVTSKAEGDHVLLVRFDVAPATFKAAPIAANGQAQGDDPQVLLPVKVFTIYGVPKTIVLAAKGGVGLVSFLLTLPAAFVLFERCFGKKTKPRRRRAA